MNTSVKQMTNETTVPQTCFHEELIQDQARRLERIEAELSYKKEKLDEIKEDNRRMETKIDEIKDCMNKIVLKSKTGDDDIQNQITALKTKIETNEKASETQFTKLSTYMAVMGIVLVVIDLFLKYGLK